MTGWLIEFERAISQAEVDQFAQISGDVNPFHVDPSLAARGPFGKTVAHGVLVTATICGLIGRNFPGRRVMQESVRFHAPTFPGDPMLYRISPGRQREGRATVRFEIARRTDGKVTCSGVCEFSP